MDKFSTPAMRANVFVDAMRTLDAWWKESYVSKKQGRAEAVRALDDINKLVELEALLAKNEKKDAKRDK